MFIRIFIFLSLYFSVLLSYGMVDPRTFEEIARDAPIILKVKVVNSIFENLNIGETVTSDDLSYWVEYHILKVYKNLHGVLLKKNIKVNYFKYGCVIESHIIKKIDHNLYKDMGEYKTEQPYESPFLEDMNTTQILFLADMNITNNLFLDRQFYHLPFSTSKFSKKLENKVLFSNF